ncbi:type VII secretion protein EccB [Actinacidiphila sp. bgisy144]|uniref:type VII secretion protein EccB n=1 Tax=unclassified Actinacidiphila TaxID=2995708 RepID=UPI003EBB4EBE
MQTRRDHVQAYQFAVGRLATALVSGDPGRGDSPTRRASLGTFFGVGIVLLLCVGFGVYGLIAPAPDHSWRASGAYIVEKETGNRYLYVGGVLRPVRNYASVLLLAGHATAHTVSQQDLSGIPHGTAVGIPGAPDEVPAPAEVLGNTWTRCLRPELNGGQSLDLSPAGHTTAVPAGRQALLAGPDGTRYLLWKGTKYPVPGQATLLALGLDTDRQTAAPADWLAAVPTGRALTAIRPAGLGEPAGKVAGHTVTVGQLFTTGTAAGGAADTSSDPTGSAGHYYVMTRDGVARTTATESALLAAQPHIPAPLQVPASALAAVKIADDPAMAGALPDVAGAPAVAGTGQAVCLAQQVDGRTLDSQVVLETGAAATGSRAVVVPPGHGVVAASREEVLKKATHPRTFLITDDGTAYRLANDDTTAALGLSGLVSVLPDDLLALLPTGPELTKPGTSGTGGSGV